MDTRDSNPLDEVEAEEDPGISSECISSSLMSMLRRFRDRPSDMKKASYV